MSDKNVIAGDIRLSEVETEARNFDNPHNSDYVKGFLGGVRICFNIIRRKIKSKKVVRLSTEDINNIIHMVRKEKERVDSFSTAACESMEESKIHALIYLDMLIDKLNQGKF